MGPYKYYDQKTFFSDQFLTSSFIGQYSNGKRQGIGHEIFEDGSGYRGNYTDDVINGRGRFISHDGKYFHGDFVAGLPQGLGTLYC